MELKCIWKSWWSY